MWFTINTAEKHCRYTERLGQPVKLQPERAARPYSPVREFKQNSQSQKTEGSLNLHMFVCVCVYLAEKGGLQLCCGVAGVKKLTKGHLQVNKKGTIKSIFPGKPPFKYSHVTPFRLNSNSTEVCLTGGGTVLYLTQKTAAIKPISLQITRAVRGAKEERVMTSKRHKNATFIYAEKSTWYKFCICEADI